MLGEQLVLAATDDKMGILVMAMAMGVAVVAIVVAAVKNVLRTREIEKTKREVAAYMAEGTITPEDAQRILGGSANDFEVKIGKAVRCGIISSGKAERLIRALREEWRKSEILGAGEYGGESDEGMTTRDLRSEMRERGIGESGL